MLRFLLAAALALVGSLALLAPPAAGARDPVDRGAARAPDGTPLCAAWVHDRHSVRVAGRRYPTWHPPRDPRHRCAFGHEHGSNPRAFRHLARAGKVAFGRVAAYAGAEEAHAGFKVFVANDDRKGLAWMVLLHQGSGSPRRGSVRFHSLEAWLIRRATRGRRARLLARVKRMADFGRAVPNCPDAERAASMRLLPHPRCEPAYEEWSTEFDVGGAVRAWPSFAIENPVTQFDPAQPSLQVPNKRRACGASDPAGWNSLCKGDRRAVFHPGWVVQNTGPSHFRTDAYGTRASGGLLQFVSNRLRVDQSGEREGVENAFVMERPSDGGLYRAGRGLSSTGFEFPGYCVLGAN